MLDHESCMRRLTRCLTTTFLAPWAAAGLLVLGAQPAWSQSQCLRIQHTNGPTYLGNGCGRRISVHWIDQRYCRSGCAESIGGGGRNAVTAWQGHTRYAVCWDYDYPRGFVQNPYGTYSCN